jgi:hypothetical protein
MYVGGKVLFSLSQDNATVTMSMFDLSGRFVREVMNKNLSTGNYSVSLDTRGIASQFYMLRVTINGTATVMKLRPASHSSVGAIVQNSTEFRTRLEKLAAVVDTIRATEPGYTLGDSAITTLAGQFDFTLKKNNTFNGDTDAFWDTTHVKKQAGHLWFTVLNRTNGQWPDSMIYLAIGDNGTPQPLSSGNTIDMTNTGGGRQTLCYGRV